MDSKSEERMEVLFRVIFIRACKPDISMKDYRISCQQEAKKIADDPSQDSFDAKAARLFMVYIVKVSTSDLAKIYKVHEKLALEIGYDIVHP